MTYRVIVSEQAEAEMHANARWYDSRCPGLGAAYLAKFELTVAQIQQFPESFERINDRYRRAVLGRFPYFIAYRTVGDTVRILRVMPEKGNPRTLKTLTE